MKIVPIMGAANTAQASPASIAAIPRRITMTTNASPDRGSAALDLASVTPDTEVQANAAPEATTQPLSPQLAALARQRRALQVKEREIAAREEALKTQPATNAGWIDPANLKSDPLRVLREQGVTYDQLTQAILGSQGNQAVAELEAKIEALKGDVDKRFTDTASQQEQQALAEMKREAEMLAKTGDDYELVRTTGSIPQVMELIERTYRDSGEVLDVAEAMQLVENHLLDETAKLAATAKLRAKLAPPPAPVPPTQQQPEPAMRTLTNRDGASIQQSRRARALAAFHGTLRK